MQVATEIGISPSMLRYWRAASRDGVSRLRVAMTGTPTLASPANHAAENIRLKRELERTRMERDISKKNDYTFDKRNGGR